MQQNQIIHLTGAAKGKTQQQQHRKRGIIQFNSIHVYSEYEKLRSADFTGYIQSESKRGNEDTRKNKGLLKGVPYDLPPGARDESGLLLKVIASREE